MKLLITGAGGLLGNRLAELATKAGHVVYSLDNSHVSAHGNQLLVDITDETAVSKALSETTPDVVIHTASITDVDMCEANPQLAMKVNGEATGFLSAACQETGSHLIYVSTDYVFDGARGHYSEQDEPAPINTYGRSKLLGEKEMMRRYPRGCIARTSVLYGWGRPFRPNFATWVHSKLAANEQIKVVTDQFASPTLNTHLAKMLLEMAESHIQGILHTAGASQVSRYEFAVMLAKQFGFNQNLLTPVEGEATSWKARRPFDSSLNVSKAQKLLTKKPATLSEALKEFTGEHQQSE